MIYVFIFNSFKFDDKYLLFNTEKYYFSYIAKDFIGNWQEENDPNGPLYTLPRRSISDHIKNYGITQTGIVDTNKERLPVSIEININFESP
jgi:hypothetical protein